MRLRGIPWVIIGLFALTWAGLVLSYDRYSVNHDATNCRACHGIFGQATVDHDDHQLMLSLGCYPCHRYDFFPVYTNWSVGDGLEPIGCIGCHGRAEDGTGTGTEGYGMGLRQHHWRKGYDVCVDCHSDADPSAATPVAESVLPPFYANPGAHPEIPGDPCSPAPDYAEDYVPDDMQGLDNDGDLLYDGADVDCAPGGATPGETSGAAIPPLLITHRDAAAGRLTLTFGNACESTDNVLEYGALSQVATYAYVGQVCAIGTSGAYDWTYPLIPASMYFLVVGRNASAEGSYGLDGRGAERPEDATNLDCPLPRELATRCD